MVRLRFFVTPNEGEIIFINRKSIYNRIERKVMFQLGIIIISILTFITLYPKNNFYHSLDKIELIFFIIIGSLLTTTVLELIVIFIMNLGLKLFPSFRSIEVLERIYFFNGFLSSTSSEKEKYKLPYSEFTHIQYDGGRNITVYCYDDLFLSDLERLTMSEVQLKYYKEKTLEEFYDNMGVKNMYHKIELKIVKKYSMVGEHLIGFLNSKISESKTLESKN